MNQDHGGYGRGRGRRGERGGGRGGFQRNFGEEEALPCYNRKRRGGRGDYSSPRRGGSGDRGDFRGGRGGHGGGNYFRGPPRDGMGFGGDKIQRNEDDRRGSDEDDEAKDIQPVIIEGSRDRGIRGRGNRRVRGVGRGDMRGGMSERGASRGKYRGGSSGGRGDFSGGFQRGDPDMGGRRGH